MRSATLIEAFGDSEIEVLDILCKSYPTGISTFCLVISADLTGT